ncbi:hypothetical protein PHYBOEH_010139 [Phytophthora boehmeriae]|uniref:Uncharacterized protein n=1 Tax=Phytophthora boehmeriae TaxID=109152 RepID=A0A8T1X054_9STRA|nr:hypothetical protein PHYBOEH_010139 [Phytophthora boehmeriae]
MTRRGPKTTTHVHRVPETKAKGGTTDLLLHRHRLSHRSSGFMLARKYRNPWPSEADFARELSARFASQTERSGSGSSATAVASTGSNSSSSSVVGLNGPKGYTREELINFWRELSVVAKRRLLRIRRETYLTALDQFLVGQNLCCECHDNVIAEWEDHERKRSGSRSLQDVFSVFPPFLDDEDDEDDDEDDEDGEDEDDEQDNELEDESDEDMIATEDMVLEEEELVFKYELERGGRRSAGGKGGMLSDEYLAAMEVGKRQEDELLRLIQKEERYIIIREDHTNFIMDLIRCGEQFSYLSPFRSGFDDDYSEESEEDDDVDDSTCPGANTSHLAQEYLLEVLAIKFREQLEDAYQEALQHSLAIQAELLRDELADLKASQKPVTSKKKKSKEKKKRRKKDQKEKTSNAPDREPVSVPHQKNTGKKVEPSLAISGDSDTEIRDPEEDAIDREVEQFRLLLEKINAESTLRSRKKLVLPPGAFAHLTTVS